MSWHQEVLLDLIPQWHVQHQITDAIEEDDQESDDDMLSFAPEEFIERNTRSLRVYTAEEANDGSEKYFDLDDNDTSLLEQSNKHDSDEQEHEQESAEKVEIEDDGFDFDATGTTLLDDEVEQALLHMSLLQCTRFLMNIIFSFRNF